MRRRLQLKVTHLLLECSSEINICWRRDDQKHSKRFKLLSNDFRALDGGGLELFIHFQCVLSSAAIAHRFKGTAAALRYFWEEDTNQGGAVSSLKADEGGISVFWLS